MGSDSGGSVGYTSSERNVLRTLLYYCVHEFKHKIVNEMFYKLLNIK
jgi:hypothetical protein